jgi:hypothetical protein
MTNELMKKDMGCNITPVTMQMHYKVPDQANGTSWKYNTLPDPVHRMPHVIT